MALPISPTPVLKGKEAEEFIEKIEREKNIRVPLVANPKLESARGKILLYAKHGKK